MGSNSRRELNPRFHQRAVHVSVRGCRTIDGRPLRGPHLVGTDSGWIRTRRAVRPFQPSISTLVGDHDTFGFG
jgi:hypothetical protein